MARPLPSPALACIAIIFLSLSVGLVSAAVPPQIMSVSPSGGPMAGGTVVTITGAGFSGTTEVRFGENAGTALEVAGDSVIRVTTPSGSAGTVAITLLNPNGTIRSGDPSTMYEYEEVSLPRVSGLSPSSGPAAGNTEVLITGSGFTGTENVRFGNVSALIQNIVDDSHIRVLTPASSPGTVAITVENAAGTGNSSGPAAVYLFEYPHPELTKVSPSSGSTAGGTSVTVSGSGFAGATEVRFGDKSGTSLNVADDSLLTVIAPPNLAGIVSLTVINPSFSGISLSSATMFRYRLPLPELTNVSPSSGPVDGGTLVTITGSGFNSTREVLFGGKPGTALNVTDDRHITVLSPAHTAGAVPIAITNSLGEGGSLGPSTMFRFVFPPATATVSPTTPASPGDNGSRGGNDIPEGSLLTTIPSAASPPATIPEPGFGAVAGLLASGIIVLLRNISP